MKRRLSAADFEAYLSSRGLPEGGEAICRRVYASTRPGRRVRSNRYHGSARVASTKTGSTRDAESLVEYRVYKLFEYLKTVLWYLAQPAEEVLREFVTVTEDGAVRRSSAWAILDTFVLWADLAPGWVDIKTLSAILAKNEAHPGFYILEGGAWRCPTSDAYAAQFGLSHTVIVDDDLNETEIANADYLKSFLDLDLDRALVARLRDRVARRPGIALADLRREGFSVDQVCAAVYEGEVFVDLKKHQLRNQELAFVYLNPVVAGQMPTPLVVAIGGKRPSPVHVAVGEEIIYGGEHYRITVVRGGSIGLEDMADESRRLDLARSDLDRAVRSGEMTGLGPIDAEARANLELLAQRYASADWQTEERACERLAVLQAYWAGEREAFPTVAGNAPSLAAVRDWQTRYRRMEGLGCGFAGLLDLPQQGRPGSHLPLATQDLIESVAATFYTTPGRIPTVAAFHRVIAGQAAAAGVVAPTYPAVLTWVGMRPQYELKRRRHGHKGAAAAKPWAALDPESAPPNGQFPGHVAHGDATRGDVFCVERFTRLGALRPNLWRLVDGMLGKKVGQAWHFGEADEAVVLEALGDQIRTHGFLSQTYVLDSALVHKTTRVQSFLAKHGSTVVYRKTSDGRSGTPVERAFGAINTDLFHILRGNTRISRDVRAMDPELDPRGNAIWPLADLIACVRARDEVVERERVVDALRMTTAEAWETRYEHGMREARLLRWTPAIERELAVRHPYRPKVSPVTGIWVNRLYYWNDVFLDPSLEGVQIEVSTIRSDIGRVWALVPRHTVDGVSKQRAWVECVCRSPLARDHVTFEELAFFTKVILAFNADDYRRKKIENGQLGEYLCEVLEREAELLEELEAVRVRNGRGREKLPDLPRNDILADAPEPAAAASTSGLTLIRGGGSEVRSAIAKPATRSINFGSSARNRADDFLPINPSELD